MSIDILRNIPFFADLSVDVLAQVWEMGEKQRYPAQSHVMQEGELADYFFIILDGEVSIQKTEGKGQSIEITRLKRGEFFGEIALLDAGIRSATVICLSDCQFFMLDQPKFIKLLSNADPRAILELVAAITRRVRATSERFFEEELGRQKLEADMQIERHRALAQMVAGVAHEINTPLGIVNTAADIIKNRVDSEQFTALGKDDKKINRVIEDVQEAAQLIEGNIRRAHKLVQDFKKISVNQVTDSLETVALPELLLTSVDLYRLNARQANLKIELKNNLVEASWEGYPASMTQVILNLLSNIERYAYDASGGNILISLDGDEENFRLVVKDEGKGIPPENLPYIFDAFFTTGRSKGGTGLGMAIVYNLVTSMFGGTIALESELGKGTSVIIDFPRRAPARLA